MLIIGLSVFSLYLAVLVLATIVCVIVLGLSTIIDAIVFLITECPTVVAVLGIFIFFLLKLFG